MSMSKTRLSSRAQLMRAALKIIAAIEDPPVIVKILSYLGLPTRARRVRWRVESIYSKRSEEPKTACQRKPIRDLSRAS
jgi:hypothetical protein